MKILIIDNTRDSDSWGSADLVSAIRRSSDSKSVESIVRRAPEHDFYPDLDSITHVIISGSKTAADSNEAWISELLKYIKKIIDKQIPVLGICFGHQMIARLYNEAEGTQQSMGPSKTPELGYVKITLNSESKKSPLWSEVPNHFLAPVTHYDEVYRLSDEFKVDAASVRCPIHSFYHPDRAIYGIQFHPERTYEKVMNSFKKIKNTDKRKFFFGQNLKKNDINEDINLKIFKNFLNIAPKRPTEKQ